VSEIRRGQVRLYTPDWVSLDWRAAVLAAVVCVLVFGAKWSVVRVLGVAAAGGLILSAIS
jgi:chromate transporter